MNTPTMHELESLQAADGLAAKARLSAITRELHDALRALGAAPELQRVLREIPDTRSRLSYVGEMTESAAHRVLGFVDEASPRASEHGRMAGELAQRIAMETAASPDPDRTARLLAECAAFAQQSADFAAGQKQTLSDIMMTQDFQDLSGQVIKKVIDVITRTETQLVQLLIDEGDADVGDVPVSAALEGPQTPDKALGQGDVDDLLASMGF